MAMPDSFWEDKYGRWTIAAVLARGFCQNERFNRELKPEELYYILDTLNIKERFAPYWDHPEFYQRAGLAYLAIGNVMKARNGIPTRRGNLAWAAGDLDAALCFYEEEMKKRKESGFNGIFRLYFAKGQFSECLEIFKEVCPPHSYFAKHIPFPDRAVPIEKTEQSQRQYKYKFISSDFISHANYMLKVIVFAAVNAGSIDDKLCQMISDYFEVSEKEINELATSLRGNDKEFIRLKKLVASLFAC